MLLFLNAQLLAFATGAVGLTAHPGLLPSVVTVLAPLTRQEVADSDAVVEHLTFDEHCFILGFLLSHGHTKVAFA